MDQELNKRLAARAALELLPEGGVIGLGTGTTTRYFIEGIAELQRGGRAYVGVPTSESSRRFAQSLGMALLDDAGPWDIALCVDGADEVNAGLDLIKGAGGAHTREKIVSFASRVNVIVVDESKLSARLGDRRAVPVEVLAYAHWQTARQLSAYGVPVWRQSEGAPFRTDSGNYIYDVRTGPVLEPAALDVALKTIPGVVETGLFCGRADVVVVAGPAGIRTLRRSAAG